MAVSFRVASASGRSRALVPSLPTCPRSTVLTWARIQHERRSRTTHALRRGPNVAARARRPVWVSRGRRPTSHHMSPSHHLSLQTSTHPSLITPDCPAPTHNDQQASSSTRASSTQQKLSLLPPVTTREPRPSSAHGNRQTTTTPSSIRIPQRWQKALPKTTLTPSCGLERPCA